MAAKHPVNAPPHPCTGGTLVRDRIPLGRVRAMDLGAYLDMGEMERHAALIVTNSGEVHKEACFHGIPCITLRDEAEWTELKELGWNGLASSIRAAIAAKMRVGLGTTGRGGCPCGDGLAAERVAQTIGNVPATQNR